MAKLTLKIIFLNIGLYLLLLIAFALVIFSAGYAESNRYQMQQTIIYIGTALVQIGINFSINKKSVFKDWRVLIIIIVIVALLYVIVPFAMR